MNTKKNKTKTNINQFLISLCCLSGLGLTACTTAPTVHDAHAAHDAHEPPAAVVIPLPVINGECEDLLAYYHRARLLPSADLPKMLTELTALTKNPHRDVQRAILLGFIRGNGDIARAQAILDGVSKSNETEAEHIKPLAYFLSANLAEWRRFDETIDKQNQQLKEAQRRFDQLSQKLEDLKAIERQLPTRPRSNPAAPPTGDNKQ